jgi:hypothetical protein
VILIIAAVTIAAYTVRRIPAIVDSSATSPTTRGALCVTSEHLERALAELCLSGEGLTNTLLGARPSQPARRALRRPSRPPII